MTKCLVSALLPSLISAVFIIAAPLGSVSANEGMSAFNRKDYNEAYRIWRRTPDAPESKYGMGRLHLEGLGGPQNSGKGLSLLNEASNAGYMPATEYLAAHYEKRKDFKNAIRYLERLAERNPSAGTQRRLVSALSSTERKPLTDSVKYCSAVKTLSELDSAIDTKKDMQDCALGGRPSTITQQAAMDSVGARLAQAPSIETLETVATGFLDPNSPKFNPRDVEQAVWALDPKLKNNRVKEILRKAGVTFEKCSSLPALSQDDKHTFNAYCTLSAIAGDPQPIAAMAKNYASGKEGRTPDLSRAAALIGLSPETSKTKDGLLIVLVALSAERNWRDHLNEMDNAGSRILDLPASDVVNQFAFQLQASQSNEYGQAESARLLRLAGLTSSADIQRATYEQLKNKRKKNEFSPDDKDFLANLCSLEVKLAGEEKNCRLADKGPADPRAILTSSQTSLYPSPVSSAPQPRQDNTTRRVPPAALTPEQKEKLVDQSVIQCDSGNLSACAVAARTLMSKFPPRGYENISEEERRKLAINRLERGAAGGAVSSLAMIYDLYSEDLDSRLRQKAQEYLAVLVQKGVPEGHLREQLAVINVDPISGTLGAIFERSKFRLACTAIKLQIQKRELNREDEIKATAALEGQICNSVK